MPARRKIGAIRRRLSHASAYVDDLFRQNSIWGGKVLEVVTIP
jgi:hypothetical protein